MAIISRKSAGAYLNKCTTCHAQWVSEDDDGGPEARLHKH